MKKLSRAGAAALVSALIFSAGAWMVAPSANAQTSSTPTTAPAASSQTPATGAAKAPAAKPKAPATTAPKSSSSTAVAGLTTDKQKASYALGMNIATGIAKNMKPGDIDDAALMRGMKDVLAGAKPAISMDDAVAALKKLQQTVQLEEDAALQQAGDANQKAGDAFLAANKSKPGVVTTASGLQYKVLTQGTGPKPAATDTVVCNYRGTLLDGKEFDSSYKRGMPATFPLNQVIKGWTEGVQLMPVGSKYEFYIPGALAYGSRGAGADIGPNSTLIFQVELISIKGK